MTEFASLSGDVPFIPDDVSVPQFFLEYDHPIRPKRPDNVPVFIEDRSGREVGMEEVRHRAACLASGLSTRFKLAEDDVVLIFSGNNLDYPICIWAVQRLMGIITMANPSFTASELSNQIQQTTPRLIISHSDKLEVARTAAQKSGIPDDRIIILEGQGVINTRCPLYGFVTIHNLIREGQGSPYGPGRKLEPGEGSRKIAFLSASSGTTGTPKVVAISHYAILGNCIQTAAHNKVERHDVPTSQKRYRPGDSCIAVLPFYHIYGLDVVLNLTLFCAMTLVVSPKFQFISFLESIQRYRISHLMVVPPQVLLLCKESKVRKFDLSSVRMLLCAGSTLSNELKEQLHVLLPHTEIGQAYGSTEATGVVSMWPPNQKHGKSGGELIPGTVARLVKPDGTYAGYNEPGELEIKTVSITMGYFGNEKATRETYVHGWIKTGDLCMLDHNHEVLFIERVKVRHSSLFSHDNPVRQSIENFIQEIMKVRGFQVSPAELEGCIVKHPWVADAGVVSIPDEYSGELPLAFVVPTAAAARAHSPEKIKTAVAKYVAENKSNFKRLAGVVLTDSIPKNPSGKLLRRILRERTRTLGLSSLQDHRAKM